MIFNKDQREEAVRRIDFIRIQLKDLKQFSNLDWGTYNGDRNVQRNVERLVENVANASIDISKIMIVGEDVEMPNSYRDIILKLGEIGILGPELAKRIAEYAGFRNILAHEYLDLRWDKIKNFIKNANQDFEDYFAAVLNKIER